MRVRIGNARLTVGCPAGVGDTESAARFSVGFGSGGDEFVNLADCLDRIDCRCT